MSVPPTPGTGTYQRSPRLALFASFVNLVFKFPLVMFTRRYQAFAAAILGFAICVLSVASNSGLADLTNRSPSPATDVNTLSPKVSQNSGSIANMPRLEASESDESLPKESAHFTIVRNAEGEIVCRAATAEEVHQRQINADRLDLRPINHLELIKGRQQQAGSGMTIILRATQQLQQNPTAQAAFVRAAANWEALIMSPITVYIDVDYGPTLFGQAWPPGVIGATNTPRRGHPYQAVRTNMIAQAEGEGNATKQGIFNALPSTTVPTDLGDSTSSTLADSTARAIGLLPLTAQSADAAARIGFNSNFSFDFDPANGITAGQTDFDAVATHEIGHALGFISDAGRNLPRPAVWDLFRFRAGTTTETFPSALRLVTIGGSPNPLQFFFVPGNAELGLSTGGPSGSTGNGGDGFQSSHWKHVSGCAGYIGLMAPAIPAGCRRTINNNDLMAASIFGYNLTNNNAPPLVPPPPPAPANDNFASAQTITGCTGSTTGATFSAGSEPNEPSHDPPDSASLSPVRSVWYQWQAPSSGTTTITTEGSDFDTILAVYTGGTVGSLTRITFNDDAKSGSVLTSRVTFNATAGNIYQIVVDGWGGDAGGVKLNWNGCNASTTPANDNFANRQTIGGCSGNLNGVTFGAGSETNEPTHDPSNPASQSPGHSVWFKWALPTGSPGTMTLTTQGSDFDTILAVYIDTGGVGSLIRIASNDDSRPGTLTSSVTFSANPGTTYAIALDGWGGDSGNFQLSWNQTNCAPPTPTPTPIPCPASFTVNHNGSAIDVNGGNGICATADGVCTLSAAIHEADLLQHCGPIDINFANVQSPIVLTNGLYIGHSVNINGPGANVLTVMRSTAPGTPNFGIMLIDFDTTVSIAGLTISNGLGDQRGGGGVYNRGRTTLANVVVSGNQTTDAYSGGGVANENSAVTLLATMTIVNSTITGNRTLKNESRNLYAGPGGGISNSGALTVINSTISGNQTGDGMFGNNFGHGGGLFNGGIGIANLINTTVTGNQTGLGGKGGGIHNNSTYNAVVNIRNTLVANNSNGSGGEGPDLFGPINSQDYNLIRVTTGATFTGVTAHNLLGQDPKLSQLGSFGGPTITQALLAGSPAINAGSNELAVDMNGNPLSTDQRGSGFSRIVESTVDIGAFEVGAAPVLLTDTTNRVIAMDSVTFVRDPLSANGLYNFSADRRTRLMIFTSGLPLTQPDATLSVTAGGIPLAVEAVGRLAGVPDMSFVIVKLDPTLAGDVSFTVTFLGKTSNAGILNITP